MHRYNKPEIIEVEEIERLVRDREPDLIEQSGRLAETHQVRGDELAEAHWITIVKLRQELKRAYTDGEKRDILADMLSNLCELAKKHGISEDEVVTTCREREEALGPVRSTWMTRVLYGDIEEE